jgi:chromosome segregation ATPase
LKTKVVKGGKKKTLRDEVLEKLRAGESWDNIASTYHPSAYRPAEEDYAHELHEESLGAKRSLDAFNLKIRDADAQEKIAGQRLSVANSQLAKAESDLSAVNGKVADAGSRLSELTRQIVDSEKKQRKKLKIVYSFFSLAQTTVLI